ncbi:hypothetical protein [Luteimonas granuli]|uniref:Uncharacterized protein n=1 Tax=Luteimonas granuli TaxID=1176533 RepID=A0A518N699_9GAMM|nr:hypothetical protein [Luteimonas granuli]QDW67432.1 hypothetical protein FPZ22_11525 [Luteimonas granuli]
MALFMVRPLPDAGAPAPVAGMGEPAPASAGGGPSAAAPMTAGAGVAAGRPTMPEAATALLAAAAPAAMTVSELPRRTAERGGSTRSQSQRAALRRSQTAADAPVRVLAASATVAPAADLRLAPVIPAEAGDALLAGSAAIAVDSDALFGGIPAATARPWPRAVLPGLSVRQPFAAGYGMPQAEAFAPFQPRVEAAAERAARRAGMAPVPPGGASAPEPGADRGTGPGLSP